MKKHTRVWAFSEYPAEYQHTAYPGDEPYQSPRQNIAHKVNTEYDAADAEKYSEREEKSTEPHRMEYDDRRDNECGRRVTGGK